MSGNEEYRKYLQNFESHVEKAALLNQGGTTNIQTLNILGGQSPTSFQSTDIPSNLRQSNATEFVGRDAEISRLHEQLMQPNRDVRIALHGMGGVGKTELVTQYALRYIKEFSGGICWISARETDVGSQIVKFARSFLNPPPSPNEEIRKQVNECWLRWREGNVLIIFDDVTDFDRIKPYFPPGQPRFKVLITTRLQYSSPGSPPIKFVELQVLDETVALELLRSILKEVREEDRRIDEEIERAEELCRWLDYLPLGLNLVGHHLARKPDLSVSTMFERLHNEKLKQEAINNADKGIAAAFELSWKELSEDAKKLGYFLSLFALAPIPWCLVEYSQKEYKPDELEKLRDDWLLKFSFLQRQNKGIYQFHHLVREFIQYKLNELDSAEDIKKRFCQEEVDLINKLFSEEPTAIVSDIEPMLFIAHIEEMATTLSYVMDDSELFISHVWLLLIYIYLGIYSQAAYWGGKCESEMTVRFSKEHPPALVNRYFLAQVYLLQGKFRLAEQYLAELLELSRKIFGNEDVFVAQVLSDLGSLRSSQGHFDEAENYCREALEIKEKQLGENNPEVASSLTALADVCRNRGKYAEAEILYQRLFELDGAESYLGNVPVVIVQFSALYLEQGCTDEAAEVCKQAIEMAENTFGDEHPIYAICLSNLAEVHLAQGSHQEAEECCKKSIEINEVKGNTGHPTHATNLMNLALIYTAQSRYEDAETLYKQALKIQQQVFGEEHSLVAETLVRLAVNYVSQGDYKQAEPLLVQGQEMYKSTLGISHPRYGELLCVLANICFHQKEYEKAENLYREAVNVVETAFGNNHPKVCEKLNILASFLISQNRSNEVEPLFQKVLEIIKKIFGESNPNVCQYMLFIAEFNRSLGRETEAESMYAQAMDIYERDDSINPDFSEGLMTLIELYESQRRYEEVEALYERLLQTSRRLLKTDEHPKIVHLLSSLARLRTEQWRYEEAAKLYEEALNIRKRIFNEKHPSIATNMVNLAYVYQSLNQFAEAKELYRQALEIRVHEYGSSHYQVRFVQNALVNLEASWEKRRKDSYLESLDLTPFSKDSTNSILLTSSESEKVQIEQQLSERTDALHREVTAQYEAVKLKASELPKLERQKAELEAELVRLQEQQKILEAEIERYNQKYQAQQSVTLTVTEQLIRLTREERGKLSEPLAIVLADLEQQRQDYQQIWEKLQTAIQQFNKYKEETDEIYVHLNAHYQTDRAIAQRLLPIDSQKVDRILQTIGNLLSDVDKELSNARTQHERSQQKSIVTF